MAAKAKRSTAKNKASDLLDKLGERVLSERVAATLSLDKAGYEKLSAICSKRGIKVSHVIDSLVADFLRDVDDAKE